MQAVAATPQHVVGRDEGEEAAVPLKKTRKRTRSEEEEEEAGPASSKRGAREEEDGEEGGKGDEGSEEGETSSPADDALSGGMATTLRRRRGATAARRKTAQRGSRSLSPTSTSSRRRQRVQHRTEEEQPAAAQEAEVEEEQHTTHVMEEEEEPDKGNGEAEPDQPPHGASGAPKANNEAAKGEEGGVADEEEEGKGVEDAAHDDNESDSVDAAVKEEEKSEEEEEGEGAENDAAGSSAMELEAQQSNGTAVSPTQNGDEVSSGEPPVTTSSPSSPKNASPRGAAAATSSMKKADEKSTSPPSQYATRRRTRGMAQEKEKQPNGGDFITGQEEIDQYILGCKSNDAATKSSGETVGPVLYKPGEEFRGLKKHVGKRLVVHIEAKHITTTNDQVTERQIWGNNGYTADSDLICVLLHTGSLKTITAEPPDYFGIALYMYILPGKSSYVGTKRGTMRSRNWSDHDVTLKLDRFEVLPTKPDDWASSEQVDGAKKSKSKKATATDEGGKSRKRRRKEANDKVSPDDAVATEKEDPEADDAATSTTMTTRSGGSRSRSRPSRSRASARAPKEELAPLTSAPTPTAKNEMSAASPSAVTPAAPGREAATAAVKQEPQADDPDAEAEADEEAGGDEHAPLTTTTTTTTSTSTANMSRMSTRSGRQPPAASASKKRSRRRPPSGGKSSRSSRSRPQLVTAGGGDWEEGRAGRTPGSDEGEIDGMKESDGADAPLADESDSDDTALRVKRNKIAGNMKLLEKIARLDRWMPLPTDVMRYNLSYEPCYHYSLGMLADRGFESDFWFSTRLRSFTLYLENDSQRFEFSYSGEATQVEPSVDALLGSQALSFLSFFSPTRMPPSTTAPPNTNSEASETTSLRPDGKKPTNRSPQDEALLEAENHNRIRVAYGHYRWAEVQRPYSMDRAELKRVGVPLPNDPASISVLAAELTWEEVAWGEGSVCVRGTTYPVHSLFWMPRSRSPSSSLAED